MATFNKPIQPTGQALAVIMICGSSGLALVIFLLCRYDHDMKLLSLGNVMGQVTALMSTASTMLVGKDFSGNHNDLPSGDFPPGSRVEQEVRTAATLPPDPPAV